MPRPFVALAVFLTLSPTTADADWPQFRGGPHQQGVAEPLPAPLEPVWTFDVPDGVEATAAIAGDTAYVAGLDGVLYALDLATGEVRWQRGVGEEIKSSPLVHDGTVYFGDELGGFHAVDAATGEERWRIEADAAVTSSATVAPSGCLLFGSYDNFLYCADPGDGSIVWKVETQGYVHGTPAVADGLAVSSGCDGLLRLVNAADGTEVAAVELGGYAAASPAVRGGRVYVGTFEAELLAVDLGDPRAGKPPEVAWRYQHPERKFPFYASAAVTAERVVVAGRDKMVHALDPKSGEALWTHARRARVDASPVISGDVVYAADQAGELFALDLDDGNELWSFETGDSFAASPAIAGGRLVIGTQGGTVYAFAGADDREKSED